MSVALTIQEKILSRNNFLDPFLRQKILPNHETQLQCPELGNVLALVELHIVPS